MEAGQPTFCPRPMQVTARSSWRLLTAPSPGSRCRSSACGVLELA